MKEVDIINKVRNHLAKMHVTQVGLKGKFYVVWLQFRDFKDAKKVITDAGRGQVTWHSAPKVKKQSELAQGERPERDNPDGWAAHIVTDSTLQHGADVVALLVGPTYPANKYIAEEMPAVANEGDQLKSQLVYYRIRHEVDTTKKLINALDKLLPNVILHLSSLIFHQ